jgi:hypothetical protein
MSQYVDINAFNECKLLDESFIVERIVEKKKVKGGYKYLVKWEGYEENQNTWEPVENLTNVQHLVDEFETQLLEKKRKREETEEALKKKDNILEMKKIDEFKFDAKVYTSDIDMAEIETKTKKEPIPKKEPTPKKEPITVKLPEKKKKLVIEDESGEKPKPVPKPELIGDINIHVPLKIVLPKILNDKPIEFNFLIEWQKVGDVIPKPSYLSSHILKKKYPEMVFEFYESHIKFL